MLDFINTQWLVILAFGYLGGYIVGSFTRNISLFKIIIFITLYLAFAELLPLLERIIRSSSSLSLVFCLGILTHQRDRIFSIISWANDFKDVIFALRYRRAFEEIRRKEEELEERERRFREEQTRHYREQQEQAKNQEQKQRSKKKQSGGSRSSHNKQSSQTRAGNSEQNKRDVCLQILGLGVGKNYSQEELKKAFRKQAKKVHPDKGGSPEAFIELVEAYEWLKR